MSPFFEMVATSSTVPSIRIRKALGGYTGGTFLTRSPVETPWEIVKDWSVGRIPVAALGTMVGRAAVWPGAAIPIRLGAAASGVALVRAGTLPPLTIRGAGSGLVAVAVSSEEGKDLLDPEAEPLFPASAVSSMMLWILSGAGALFCEIEVAPAFGCDFGELATG